MHYRKRSSARSLRLAETLLRATGPVSSPRPSRDKTSLLSSPTLALVAVLVVPPLMLAPLVVTHPLKKKRSPVSTYFHHNLKSFFNDYNMLMTKMCSLVIEEEEPEEDVDMGDLFGGGDDDY